MNEFDGRARGSDYKILPFGLIALARECGASHFLCQTPAKISGKASGSPFGGVWEADIGPPHKLGHIRIQSIMRSIHTCR
jgi:hypothetical protein